jgi:hypothetical protein
VLLVVENGDSLGAGAIATPAGFTKVFATSPTSGIVVTNVYWKLYNSASTGDTVTVTVSGAHRFSVSGVRISGANTAAPFGPWTAPTFSSAVTVNSPPHSVGADNASLVIGVDDEDTARWTGPTGYTEQSDSLGHAYYWRVGTSAATGGFTLGKPEGGSYLGGPDYLGGATTNRTLSSSVGGSTKVAYGVEVVTAVTNDRTVSAGVATATGTAFDAFAGSTTVRVNPQTATAAGAAYGAGAGTVSAIVVPTLNPQRPWGTTKRWNAWVEVLNGGTLVASSARGDFTLTGGRLNEDLTRSIVGDISLDITLEAGPRGHHPFLPIDLGYLFDPNAGSRMVVYAGFEGDEKRMGEFDMASTPLSLEPGGVVMHVAGHSLERLLQRAGFWVVECTTNGTRTTTAIYNLIANALGPINVLAESNNSTVTDYSFKPGDDRLKKILELATAAGMEARFDREGNFRLTKAPTSQDFGSHGYRWHFVDGINSKVATLSKAAREFSDENTYNGVIIEGDSHATPNAPPIVFSLFNSRKGSVLYFDPYNPASSQNGPRPKYIRSDLVTTLEQAMSMAAAELFKVLAVADSVTATVPANADIEVGDYARLQCEGLGVDAIYRIVRTAHDLAGGPCTVGLYREQNV